MIIGGIEASLRRFAHYDYWDDKVRRSILLDAKADLLIYGMGERAVAEIAEALDSGIDVADIGWIRGTVYRAVNAKHKQDVTEEAFEKEMFGDKDTVMLPTFEELAGNPDTAWENPAAASERSHAGNPEEAKKKLQKLSPSVPKQRLHQRETAGRKIRQDGICGPEPASGTIEYPGTG